MILAGGWHMRTKLPDVHRVEKILDRYPKINSMVFDVKSVLDWDSALVTFLVEVDLICEKRGIQVDLRPLPDRLKRLLNIAIAATRRIEAPKPREKQAWVREIGNWTIQFVRHCNEALFFIGEMWLSNLRFFSKSTRNLHDEIPYTVQQCGPRALPIIAFIAFLMGFILALIGLLQVAQFGAAIYVANIVNIGMVREMAPIITAIIMAGRSGAAYAAELGMMRFNDEIDALYTEVISPMDFLVYPRVIALVWMMPLLCIFADFFGVLGGYVVAVGILDLASVEYIYQTQEAVSIADVLVGVFKSVIFGLIIAIASCLRGMKAEHNAAAVGRAATSAVVTSIVYIIMADAFLTYLFYLVEL